MKKVVNELTKVVSFGLILISHFWARKLEAPTPGTWAHNQCWHFCVVLNWCWTVWAAVFWMGCYIKDLSTVCGLKKQLVMTLFKENHETSRVSFSLWDPFPYNGLLLHVGLCHIALQCNRWYTHKYFIANNISKSWRMAFFFFSFYLDFTL